MKRIFLVEWGTESSMGALDDPCRWEFDDLYEAIAFYDDIDLRYNWVREYNTSHGASRDGVMAKQIIDCMVSNGGHVNEYGQVLQFDEYGETEYRAEEEEFLGE